MKTCFTATEPSRQVERLYELNIGRNWGFERAEFDYAERHIPPWPDGEIVVVTLVPYLRGTSARVGSVKRTFQELLNAATKEQKRKDIWDDFKDPRPDILRVIEGSHHEPGLRWEVIDLGANLGRRPNDVCNPLKSFPHAGVLASAALHPEWIRSMDGASVPFVTIPGYEVDIGWASKDSLDAWDHVPLIANYHGEEIKVDVVERYVSDGEWSNPEFFHLS